MKIWKLSHTGVLYRLAYLWHKPDEKPTGRVYICDTLGLALFSLIRMVGYLVAAIFFLTYAFVFAQLFFSCFAGAGAEAMSWFGFTDLAARAEDLQLVPAIIAACVGVVAILGAGALVLLGLGLFWSETRRLYLAGLRALKERFCPIWEVV